MVSRIAVVRMAGVAAVEHDSGVLDAAVTESEQCADGSDAVDAREGDEHLDPVRRDDLGVVVQEQEVLAVALDDTQVDLAREVERLAILDEAEVFTGDRLERSERVRIGRGVEHTDELVVLVRRTLDDAPHAVDDQRHDLSAYAAARFRRWE